MKIASSTVTMEGRSRSISEETASSSLRVWDNRKGGANGIANTDQLSLSPEGISLASLNSKASEMALSNSTVGTYNWYSPLDRTEEAELEDYLSDKDARDLALLERLLEAMTGKRFKFNRLLIRQPHSSNMEKRLSEPIIAQINTPAINIGMTSSQNIPSLGWGIQYHSEITKALKETVDFSTHGSIKTEDGSTVDFELNYHFSQEVYSRSVVDFKAGDALIDPLVIRLEDGPMNYSKDPIRFDLDIDGIQDEFRVPIDSAGLLFLDGNGNHIADDGSELFGPQTDNGFGELGKLDSDHNGWIDENDSAFKDLRIWVRSGDGTDRYLGLIEAGVGALFVQGAQTDAALYNESVEQVGAMKATGFYLSENGKPGLIHELDFKI